MWRWDLRGAGVIVAALACWGGEAVEGGRLCPFPVPIPGLVGFGGDGEVGGGGGERVEVHSGCGRLVV